jgi:tetratricopeptide (TPR) repeat protein
MKVYSFPGASLASALAVTLLLALQAETKWQQATRLFEQRRFAEAVAILEPLVAGEPHNGRALLLLAFSYEQTGELQRAQALLERAVDLQVPGSRYHLARVQFLRGRLTEAENSLFHARSAGEPIYRVLLLQGMIAAERGHFEQALSALQQARQTSPRAFVEPWIQSALVLRRLGKAREAVELLEEALARAPASQAVREQLAKARREVLERPATAPRPIRLVEQPLPFSLDNAASAAKRLPETMAGGLALFDYDNDGRLDLFFTNGSALPANTKTHARFWNRLLRNLGSLQFEDVTAQAGVRGAGFSVGAAAADFDNDGFCDLFVAGVYHNQLLRNHGDGRFEDITQQAGIASAEWSVGGAWLDFDRDSLLDLFVVNYLNWRAESEPFCGDLLKHFRVYCHPKEFHGTANRLYRNLGNGRFQDVSLSSGVAKHVGKGMSTAMADYDHDGWPDIFVANDQMPNFLFHNLGDGRFEEIALQAGVALPDSGRPVSAMGSDFQDYDNDGRPDLIFTALSGETFPLFRNRRRGQFEERTFASGLGALSYPLSGWGVAFADLNNDGWKDLVTANSHVTDNIDQFSHWNYHQPVTAFAGMGGFFVQAWQGAHRAHRGLAVADLDEDGQLDVIVSVLGGPAVLLHNTSAQANWLRVRLRGRRSNRDGIGALVEVDGQIRQATSAVGYASSVRAPLHFGLGHNSVARRIQITWPSGIVQTLRDVAANQTVQMEEPD